MSRHGPENERKRCNERRHESADPDRPSEKQFFDVGFSDPQGAEGRRFGLSKENKDGVEFVLMRYEAEDGDCEW